MVGVGRGHREPFQNSAIELGPEGQRECLPCFCEVLIWSDCLGFCGMRQLKVMVGMLPGLLVACSCPSLPHLWACLSSPSAGTLGARGTSLPIVA